MNQQDAVLGLISERWAYTTRAKLIRADIALATVEQRARQKIYRATREDVITRFKSNDIRAAAARSQLRKVDLDLATVGEEVKVIRQPFGEKLRPYTQAIKIMDSTIIPEALAEVGHKINIKRFTSVSKYVLDAIALEQATKLKARLSK